MHKLHVHFLGIGGSGASHAAVIAQAQGYEITGCDKDLSSEFLKPFDKKQLFLNHNPNHLIIGDRQEALGNSNHSSKDAESNAYSLQPTASYVDMLVVTPAVFSLDADNKELVKAKEKGIPVLTWQEFLGKYLAKGKQVIAVCGTHGKSTTTAMIGLLLENAGFDPTVELGAIVPEWGANYRISSRHSELVSESSKTLKQIQGDNNTQKEYFVIEADEYNDNFLHYTPDITIVTNIEMDHPEYFKDFEAVKESFKKFLGQTKQTIIANFKDPGIDSVIARLEEAWQSRLKNNPNQIASSQAPRNDVNVVDYSKYLIDFPLQIPGEHNILNASAVFQLGLQLKIDPERIKQSLMNFTGASRRFEKIGEYNNAQIYSDFGHHPTEIKVTMEAAKEKFPDKRIWLIYQPHMFSRTKALFDDFVKVFQDLPVDGTVILDIYPSREKDTGLVSSKELVAAINKENVEYVASWEELKGEMQKSLGENDVVFFMGAGDTDKWAKELCTRNQSK